MTCGPANRLFWSITCVCACVSIHPVVNRVTTQPQPSILYLVCRKKKQQTKNVNLCVLGTRQTISRGKKAHTLHTQAHTHTHTRCVQKYVRRKAVIYVDGRSDGDTSCAYGVLVWVGIYINIISVQAQPHHLLFFVFCFSSRRLLLTEPIQACTCHTRNYNDRNLNIYFFRCTCKVGHIENTHNWKIKKQ